MHRSKETSKLCVTGLCAGKPLLTGEFPAQRASNAENVSIWWRHHVTLSSDGTLDVSSRRETLAGYMEIWRWRHMSCIGTKHLTNYSTTWANKQDIKVPHCCPFTKGNPCWRGFLSQKASNSETVSLSWRHEWKQHAGKWNSAELNYRQISGTRRVKSQNLNVSRLV